MVYEQNMVGLKSIDDILKNIYSEQRSLYVEKVSKGYILEDKEPLHGVKIYLSNSGGSHWHYTTYGFTELYEKELEYNEVSGFGFELTFRLSQRKNEVSPPKWPIKLLQELAFYTFRTGKVYCHNQGLELKELLIENEYKNINGVLFQQDYEMKSRNTPNGIIEFLQVVTLTKDEMDAVKLWNPKNFFAVLNDEIPLGINDVERKSILINKEIRNKIDNGIKKDGSSLLEIFSHNYSWNREKNIMWNDKYQLSISKEESKVLIGVLKGRLGKGREISILGSKYETKFIPSNKFNIVEEENILSIFLTKNNILDLIKNLKYEEGIYVIKELKGLKINIE